MSFVAKKLLGPKLHAEKSQPPVNTAVTPKTNWLELVGTGWNRLESVGTGWNRLELVGIGWNWWELVGIGGNLRKPGKIGKASPRITRITQIKRIKQINIGSTDYTNCTK